jgi:hypothetical protein
LASENLITMLKKLLGRVLWPKRAGARSEGETSTELSELGPDVVVLEDATSSVTGD